jgi:hypothetical protein
VESCQRQRDLLSWPTSSRLLWKSMVHYLVCKISVQGTSTIFSYGLWNQIILLSALTVTFLGAFEGLQKAAIRLFIYIIFIGPCIVIYSYSTTNKRHLSSQIMYCCITHYIFQTVFDIYHYCVRSFELLMIDGKTV